MSNPPLSILLVEDSPDDSTLIDDILATARHLNSDLTRTDHLATGLQYISARRFDLILLDLSLPDCAGVEAYLQVRRHAPGLPVVVLTAADDATGPKAIQAGALDYLVKGQITGSLLIRAIRYAIERNRAQIELRNQSWIDELTGLYNRRAFADLAARHIKLMQRLEKGLLLLIADLENLPAINAQHGLAAGDQSLTALAQILQRTFRSSDVLARVSGEQFAVLVPGAEVENIGLITQRLQANVGHFNSRATPAHWLTVRADAVEFDSAMHITADNWLAEIESLLRKRRTDESHS